MIFRYLVACAVLALSCASSRSHRRAVQHDAPRVLVLTPTVSGVALFADERSALQDAVRDFLRAQSSTRVRVLPRRTHDAVITRLAASRIGTDGPVCAHVPGTWVALSMTHPHALLASTHAWCADDSCTLSLSLEHAYRAGYRSRPPLARWEATLPPNASPAQWVEAVRRFALPPPSNGGGGLLASMNPSTVRVEVLSVTATGPWRTPPTPAAFREVQRVLDGCHVRRSSSGDDELMIEVDPAGAIARCEALAHDRFDEAPRMACLCNAVRGLHFEAGTSGRRLHASVMNHPASGVAHREGCAHASVASLRSDDAWVTTAGIADIDEALERCAADLAAPTQVAAQLTVAPDGTARESTVAPSTSPNLAACVGAALRRAKLTCTASGRDATVALTVRMYVARGRCTEFREP
jgi:hypothetical protein